MKPRTVYVMLQLETDAPLAALRKKVYWRALLNCAVAPSWLKCETIEVVQAQANVSQPPKAKKGAKRGAK